MTMELTQKEVRAVMDNRAKESERNAPRIIGDVIYSEGGITVTRYIGGHHPQYAVYDGMQMICLCVYKKGATALLEYINKMKGVVK